MMDTVTVLHLNDIYNADKSAKFLFQWKQVKQEEEEKGRSCLSFFSGDAWSPSIMTTIVRGKQMVPVLNAMKLNAACLGNHDLDLGLVEFAILRDQCTFPWVCSNVRHVPSDNAPLGGCHEYVVVESNQGNLKVKFLVLGLIEEGWIDTLSTIDPEDIDFEDFSTYVKRRVPELVAEHKVDAVVCMSHMRMPNDYRLANECGGYIDIILGGHDHHYEDSIINDIRVLNSGTDFSDFSVVEILGRQDEPRQPKAGGESPLLFNRPLKTSCRRVQIDPASPNDDPEMTEALKGIQSLMDSTMDLQIGNTKVDLDARFQEIRTKETNISNFVANLMTRATNADIAILNSGTLRTDGIIPKGPIRVKDLYDLLPMADPLEVIELNADKVVQALENGVSKFPAMEGRFPCVDGIRFSFDPSKLPGSRIMEGSVLVYDKSSQKYEPLNPNKKYTVVSKAYLIKGKDGYDSFVGAPVVLDDESCPALPILLRNLFTEISVMKRWQGCTVKATVIDAASKFKKSIRRSIADPYAISPVVDGRITNIAAEKA